MQIDGTTVKNHHRKQGTGDSKRIRRFRWTDGSGRRERVAARDPAPRNCAAHATGSAHRSKGHAPGRYLHRRFQTVPEADPQMSFAYEKDPGLRPRR